MKSYIEHSSCGMLHVAHSNYFIVTKRRQTHKEKLTFDNRQITVRDITSKTRMRVGGIKGIIHEHLFFKKACTELVSKMLTFNQKAKHVALSAKNLHQLKTT
jgi:hypothetical protein